MKNKGLLIAGAGIVGLLLLSGSKGKPEDMGGSSGMAGTGGFSLIALPTGLASGGASDGSSSYPNLPNVVINESAEMQSIPVDETKKSVASTPTATSSGSSSKSSSVVLSNLGSKALSSPISNPLSYSKTSDAISSLDTKKSASTKALENVAGKSSLNTPTSIVSNIARGFSSFFKRK